jgi:hypothetical protein
MPHLAMAYLMTGEKRYLEASKQWALASCAYPTWGYGRNDGMDLAAGHQLFGLAVVYDWCYHDLDEASRRRIRDTLIKRASAMFQAAATGKIWWHRSYLQNHLWVNACGLAAAGFALFDETEQARLWVGLAQGKFRRTMDVLGPDGASHEGVGYWEYGAEYMLKFMHLADELLGVDLYNHPWWRNTARYCQYLSLPKEGWPRKGYSVEARKARYALWHPVSIAPVPWHGGDCPEPSPQGPVGRYAGLCALISPTAAAHPRRSCGGEDGSGKSHIQVRMQRRKFACD